MTASGKLNNIREALAIARAVREPTSNVPADEGTPEVYPEVDARFLDLLDALGGRLRVVADFADHTEVVSTSQIDREDIHGRAVAGCARFGRQRRGRRSPANGAGKGGFGTDWLSSPRPQDGTS